MKSYITTPIYYVNGAPHIGHVHTTVMADILKRNRRTLGYETKLTTGCDEHGQKNQEASEKSGLNCYKFLEQRSREFRHVFDLMNVDYDFFVRTSYPEHMRQVASIEQRMFDSGLIVKKQYSGQYCTGCEQFKKTTDLNEEGRCPDHPNIELQNMDELNYFLRIEPFREKLLNHIDKNPEFVNPPVYRVELKRMLSEPLEDLCVSRPKHRVSLGVELPFDSDYVTYVWFDALVNYLTNLGWPNNDYLEWWKTAEHIIGKDILKTHGIYWPIMLMSIGEAPPNRLSVHGHWVSTGGMKMSKTLGNVVNPIDVVNKFGPDALRYYLARHMRAESNSLISMDLIHRTYNSELSNKIGNLFSRAAKFAEQYFNKSVPECNLLDSADEAIRGEVLEVAQGYACKIEMPEIPDRLQSIITTFESMNNYFTDQAPWSSIKKPETCERSQTVVYVTLDCLRLLFEALRQVMPITADDALALLQSSVNNDVTWVPELDSLKPGIILGEIKPLFPRVTD